jgi:HK97 family phage portal protein
MVTYVLVYITDAFTKLVGECYWLKVRDEKGHVIEIDPIPPAWVKGIPTAGQPYYTVYPYGTTSSKSMKVPPQDMVRFLRPNLSDPYGRGRGDSEPLEDELQTDEYLAKMQGSFAFNDGTPPFLLSVPGMQEAQANELKESWMQKFGGYQHRREPAVVGFDAKIERLSMDPVELDMIESRKFIRDMASEHYQIPPEILGRLENSNRATIDTAFYLYNKNVLAFEYGFLEKVITRQLIVPEFDSGAILKFKPDIPEDEDQKLRIMSAGVQSGTVTVDEWRQAFHLPPLPDDKGKVLLRQMSVYEIPVSAQDVIDIQPEEPTQVAPPKPDEAVELPADVTQEINLALIRTKSEREARRNAVWKSYDARARAHEQEYINAVKKFSGEQKKRVVAALNSKKVSDAIRDRTAIQTEVLSALQSVFNEQTNKALKSALAPAWQNSMVAGQEHTQEILGTQKDAAGSFDTFNSLVNSWIENFGLIKARDINTTTYDKLREELDAAIADELASGGTVNDIKNTIMDICDSVYDDMDSRRATMIARTETCSAQSFGSFIEAKAENAQSKTWISTLDDRTRGNGPHDEFDHVSANGETVPIDEPFIQSGEPIMYPGDPEASPGNTIACRCAMIFNEDES